MVERWRFAGAVGAFRTVGPLSGSDPWPELGEAHISSNSASLPPLSRPSRMVRYPLHFQASSLDLVDNLVVQDEVGYKWAARGQAGQWIGRRQSSPRKASCRTPNQPPTLCPFAIIGPRRRPSPTRTERMHHEMQKPSSTPHSGQQYSPRVAEPLPSVLIQQS